MRCHYHHDYYFPLPESHPFPMDKFWRAEAMIRAESPPSLRILPAEPAPFEDLLRVHTPAYLEQIRSASLDPAAALKLGLPAGETLLERSRLETGGTLLAAEAALSDGLAKFRPGLVFWLSGADPHEHDRFGQILLADTDMTARDAHVLATVRSLGVPLVVLYAGGYNRDREHTARLHARTILAAARA